MQKKVTKNGPQLIWKHLKTDNWKRIIHPNTIWYSIIIDVLPICLVHLIHNQNEEKIQGKTLKKKQNACG